MTFQLGWTIFFGIVGGIAALIGVPAAIVTAVKYRRLSDEDKRRSADDPPAGAMAAVFGVGAALVCGVLIAVVLALTSMTFVGTRQIAVETSFGKPTGKSFNNGFHFKHFWTVTHEMDGAVQIDKYIKDGNNDARIQVRLGNSSTANADVSIRWQMRQEAAPELYQQYKSFDNVRVNLVERNLAVALNEVFATFDPLAPQNLDRSPLPSMAGHATRILRDMEVSPNVKLSDQIDILDINIPTIGYDQGTEDKINQLNQQRAQTSIATEAQKTAEQQALANEKLSTSISHDPNVIVQNCINAAVAKGISPLGCWPGTSAMPTVPAK